MFSSKLKSINSSRLKALSLVVLVLSVFGVAYLLSQFRQSDKGEVLGAVSPWTQTNWSGGDGQANWLDATKFDSQSGIDYQTVGSIKLGLTERLTNTGFESDLSGWSEKQDYILNDEFTTDVPAGSVNGSQAVPSGGTRTVVDTTGKVSVANGILNVSGGVAWGDPGLWYGSISRSAGKLLLGDFSATSRYNQFGFDINQGGTMNGSYFYPYSGNYYVGDSGGTPLSGSLSYGTTHRFAIVLRNTGAYYYVKGGEYTDWSLVSIGNADSASTLYPGFSNNIGVFTIDNVRIPTTTWLPTPIAYDTFTRSNGSIGNTESTGPDSQTTAVSAWSGSRASISNNKMIITPGVGSELWKTGASTFESGTYSWVPYGSNTFANVSNALEITYVNNHAGGYEYLNSSTDLLSNLTVGTWYRNDLDAKINTGSADLYFYTSPTTDPTIPITETNLTTKPRTFRANHVANNYITLNNMGAGEIVTLDNLSMKPLTTSTLFSTLSTSDSDVFISSDVTVNTGTQAGLVTNLDSDSSPANFLIAYQNGTKVRLEKSVGGVYTTLLDITTAYVAGAKLQVATYHSAADTLKVRVYYNNVLVGSEQTVTDAAIVNNTRHGIFSTYAGNTFDNFVIFPRGTSTTKYTSAPFEDLTATRDTGTTYNGSSASAKLVATFNDGIFTQSVNTTDTKAYILSAFVYTTGATVNSADLELYINNATVSTTYTAVGGGWYKLTANLAGTASPIKYGVKVKAGKTVYVDDMSLSRYADSGTLTSSIFDSDFTNGADWDVLTYTATNPGATALAIKARGGLQSDLSDASDWSTCSAIPSGTDLITTDCVSYGDRYIQYQVAMTDDGAQNTPTLDTISIAFSAADDIPPILNASELGLTNGVDAGWNRFEDTITWTEGADNVGGEGILGYCISLDEAEVGLSSLLDPAITGGVLDGLDDGVTENFCPFIAVGAQIDLSQIAGLTLTTGKQYYFSIKAVDIVGNIWTGASNEYQDLISFKYDNTAPENIGFISLPGSFVSSKNVTITWPTSGGDSASDANSGLAGLQYRIGNSGTWYGALHNGNQDLTDLLNANDGAYTTDPIVDYPLLSDGNNYFYFRALDNAGNVSVGYVTGVLKLNTSAPSSVLNLEVTPLTNTENSYSFDWDPPSTYIGQESSITYCYSVNTLPTANTCNYTGAGVTMLAAGAYATQPGENTMYVVARDEALNTNYATAEVATFTYSGSAPGIPLGISVSDISIKSTANWKLAISWDAPTDVGAGIDSYKVYRSTTNATCSANPELFSEIGATNGTSYVDADLTQQSYYYCAKACDSANNCSAFSSTVSEFPTGKYTSPAVLISGPKITSISTRKVVIEWVTDRGSDSRIQYGLAPSQYFTQEVGNSTQVTTHIVEITNLEPDTTYFYRAHWTDEDGNIGYAPEATFVTEPPPSISSVGVSRIGLESAIINFKIKDAVKATVNYGETAAYGGSVETNTSTAESSYSIPIQALKDGTSYHYQLKLQDSEGSVYTFEDHQFSTLPRPKISNVQLQEVIGTAQPTIEAIWSTNTLTTSVIEYYPEGAPDEAIEEVDLDLVENDHTLQISNLKPNTKYVMIIKGSDAFGNEATSAQYTFTTATDSRPPKVRRIDSESVITVAEIGGDPRAQLIVTWNTDELSIGQVEFGEGTGRNYDSKSQTEKVYTNDHTIVISDLDPSRVYHFRVVATDVAGNKTLSEATVVITPKGSSSALELVLGNLSDIFSFLR